MSTPSTGGSKCWRRGVAKAPQTKGLTGRQMCVSSLVLSPGEGQDDSEFPQPPQP